MEKSVKERLNEIAKQALIRKPSIICTYTPGKGEGYLGTIQMFEISDKSHPNAEHLHVIVKQSPNEEVITKRIPIREVFLTEINFYDIIYTCMEKFQSKYLGDRRCFNGFARCLQSSTLPRQEMLILENVQPHGYKMLDRSIPIGHVHMQLCFEELAKFHAISFAMKRLQPQMFEEIRNAYPRANILADLYDRLGFEHYVHAMMTKCKTLLRGSDIASVFDEFAERIMDEFHKAQTADEFAVVCHGDAWCNNILFKHTPEMHPCGLILIDFQLSRIVSPVTDLSCLFYGCAGIELLPNFNYYLKTYHDMLTQSLSMFGVHADDVFSFDQLMQDWKTFGKYGFILAPLMRTIMLSESSESADLTLAAKNQRYMMMAFNYEMKRQHEWDRTMKAIITHYVLEKLTDVY